MFAAHSFPRRRAVPRSFVKVGLTAKLRRLIISPRPAGEFCADFREE